MGDFTSTVRELNFATPRGSAPRPRRVLTYEEAVAQRASRLADSERQLLTGPEGEVDPTPAEMEIRLWQPSMERLNATTTNQETYTAHPIESSPPRRAREYVPSPHKCEGVSTTQAAHSNSAIRAIPLPDHIPLDVGVQTQGGHFHLMIPRGSTTPISRSAVFTTCVDDQTAVSPPAPRAPRRRA